MTGYDRMNTQPQKQRKSRRWVAALSLTAALAVFAAGCGVQYGVSNQATDQPAATVMTTADPGMQSETFAQPSTGAYFSVETAATLPSTGGKQALSTIDIYKMCSESVVALTTTGTTVNYFGQQTAMQSAGSGVVISADGYILTCNHVIEDMNKIAVLMNDGKEYEAKVVGGDRTMDLAVLKIEATGLTPVTLGDSDQLQVGELAVAIGNPLGQFANSQTTGTISGKDRALNIDGVLMNLLQHDAAISPGNSGGGLFNSYGELIGITSAKSAGTAVEGVGFAIPINDAKAIINDLVNYGYVTRPQIGISGVTISEETAKQYDMPKGVYVVEVTEGGAADKAGIKVGDVITKVDGTEINSIEELTRLKNQKNIGDTLKMTIVHGNSEQEVNVVLQQEQQATATPEATPEASSNLPEGLPPIFEDFFR